MAELFIAWNQNFNKLIDFIDYHIVRVGNPRLIIHAFVARNIAEKDSPRNLNYILRHECLTNADDSTEAQLIAYVLRNYLSGQAQERGEYSHGKSLLFVQTRPGQHEELLMLLAGVTEFTSRFVAKIYKMDEELKNGTMQELRRRPHRLIEYSTYYTTRSNDLPNGHFYKGVDSNSTTGCEGQDASNDKSAKWPNDYRASDYERETSHYREKVYPKLRGPSKTQRETNNFRAETPIHLYPETDFRREIEHEKSDNGSRQNEARKDENSFSKNYEKNRVCEEYISQDGSFQVPATRRTWPTTQSGRRKRDERMKYCGRCKQQFHCFHVSNEKISTRFRPQNSFESAFDDLDNLERKSNDTRIAYGYEQNIPPKADYAPWGNTKNSRCNCSDIRICTRCFVKQLESSTMSMKRGNLPPENQSFLMRKLLSERPETSPAALQGKWERNESLREKSQARKSKNKGKSGEASETNVKIDEEVNEYGDYLKKIAKGTPSSEGRISRDHTFENNGRDFGVEPADSRVLPRGILRDENDSMRKKELSSMAKGNGLHDDGDFQKNLDKLIARLEARTPVTQILEQENANGNSDDKTDTERRYFMDTENKRGLPNHFKNDAKIYDQPKRYLDIDQNHNDPSRINSYDNDYGSLQPQDSLVNAAKNKEKRTMESTRDNKFEYGIFDQLDKHLEIEKTAKTKRKRDNQTLDRGNLNIENGKYTCEFCPEKKFASVHVWRIHMKNSHKKCNCPCGKYFETREDYLTHFYSLFPLACLLERKCPERFRSLYFQAVHHREKHFSDRPFYCVQCFGADDDPKIKRRTCFKDIKSLRIHAESMGHDPNDLFLISSQTDADDETLPWSMKCTGIDFC